MSGLNISVDDELVEPIVRAEIQTAIIRQLESDKNLIPKLVEAALAEKVDKDGKRSGYSRSWHYIDYLCKNAIQDASKLAMQEYLEENSNKLKEEIKKQLHKSESKLAEIFVDGMIGALQHRWTFTVNVKMPEQE